MIYNINGDIRCHIELSNYCNAYCPMCGRNKVSGPYKGYEMNLSNHGVNDSELRIKDIKNIFDNKFFSTYNLTDINLCGNRGDPSTASDLFEIFEYFLQMKPDVNITMATNGGLKTKQYWYKLGELTSKYSGKIKVVFGIDGLEDTNHLYRVGVNFTKVIDNAKHFINAGGKAEWQYLVFKHNEHQIGEAKALAEYLGFQKFFIIHTPRFAHTQKRDGYYVYKHKGQTYTLQTADPEFYNRKEVVDYVVSEDMVDIDCKAKKVKEFYIDCHGELQPCCWIGNALFNVSEVNRAFNDPLMNLYNPSDMNVIHNDLTETLQHEFISECIPSSWKDGSSHTCKAFCSSNKNISKKREYV